MITVSKALLAHDINAYSDEGEQRKKAFHTAAKRFLKDLAAELRIPSSEYDLRSNVAGMAVSGEVTLDTDHLYVQLAESCVGDRGISMLYRTCKGRKDCCGGQNNFLNMKQFADIDRQAEVLERLRRMAHPTVSA